MLVHRPPGYSGGPGPRSSLERIGTQNEYYEPAVAQWWALLLLSVALGGALGALTSVSVGLLVTLVSCLTGGVWRASRARSIARPRLGSLRASARAAGLEQAGLLVGSPTFRGIRAGCRLAVSPVTWSGEDAVRLVLSPKEPVPGHLTMAVELGAQGLQQEAPLSLALLTGRFLALSRPGDRLSLEQGQLRLETPFDPDDPPDFAALADSLAEGLHSLMRGDRSVPTRLLQLVAQDPDLRLREAALRALASDRSGGPESHQALRLALGDPSPTLRLTAARVLGADAQDVLQGLALAKEVPVATRAEALELWARFSPQDAAQAADRALEAGPPELRAAAARVLGRVGAPTSASALRAHLPNAHGSELSALADALARVGDAEAAAELAVALDRASWVEAPALLSALGVLGDGRSTGAIRDFLRRAHLPRALGFAGQVALEAIHDRGWQEPAGALSLSGVPAEVGGLAFCDDEG